MSTVNGGRQVRWLFACLTLLAPVGGCGEEAHKYAAESKTTEYSAPTEGRLAAVPARFPSADKQVQEGGGATITPAAMPRKIIYNGYIDLVVGDLGAVETKLMALLQSTGGYVSDTNVTVSPGSQRSGTWKVRVPAEHFSEVMSAIAKLGELRSNRTDSQDVSQEYYDIEARIAVKKQEEKRLLKILEEAAGKLKDILEVEKELSRVRSETEQMEGRLRWLAHNTALSTITITVTEIKNYRPPVAPTLAQRITRTFQASTERLSEFLMGVTLVVVAIVPWLILIVPAATIAWLVLRRLRTAHS